MKCGEMNHLTIDMMRTMLGEILVEIHENCGRSGIKEYVNDIRLNLPSKITYMKPQQLRVEFSNTLSKYKIIEEDGKKILVVG